MLFKFITQGVELRSKVTTHRIEANSGGKESIIDQAARGYLAVSDRHHGSESVNNIPQLRVIHEMTKASWNLHSIALLDHGQLALYKMIQRAKKSIKKRGPSGQLIGRSTPRDAGRLILSLPASGVADAKIRKTKNKVSLESSFSPFECCKRPRAGKTLQTNERSDG